MTLTGVLPQTKLWIILFSIACETCILTLYARAQQQLDQSLKVVEVQTEVKLHRAPKGVVVAAERARVSKSKVIAEGIVVIESATGAIEDNAAILIADEGVEVLLVDKKNMTQFIDTSLMIAVEAAREVETIVEIEVGTETEGESRRFRETMKAM
jgi:transposase